MRTIEKIIIHCTATPEGRITTVDEIRKWHKARGFSDIGYHYVIHLNGILEVGRPLTRPGAHTKGYNKNSIGIAYVGGVDKKGKAKDTRTEDQKRALKDVIFLLKQDHPNATIHGHNEFANKACPSFNVQTEL